jgi:hypothetical protein
MRKCDGRGWDVKMCRKLTNKLSICGEWVLCFIVAEIIVNLNDVLINLWTVTRVREQN